MPIQLARSDEDRMISLLDSFLAVGPQSRGANPPPLERLPSRDEYSVSRGDSLLYTPPRNIPRASSAANKRLAAADARAALLPECGEPILEVELRRLHSNIESLSALSESLNSDSGARLSSFSVTPRAPSRSRMTTPKRRQSTQIQSQRAPSAQRAPQRPPSGTRAPVTRAAVQRLTRNTNVLNDRIAAAQQKIRDLERENTQLRRVLEKRKAALQSLASLKEENQRLLEALRVSERIRTEQKAQLEFYRSHARL